MTREDIAQERALKLHDLALSVVRAKGTPRLESSGTILEYHYGHLDVQYRQGVGRLDVWFIRRVLSVQRFAGKPELMHYAPGDWEGHLIEVAKVAA
jgi:hypothetical protein